MKFIKKFMSFLTAGSLVVTAVSCGGLEQSSSSVQPSVPSDNAPVISGAVDKTIEKGTKFVPLSGVTATDVEDGDITENIVYSGNVNANKEGTYTATYTVYDNDGNEAKVTVTITVVYTDNAKPMISGVADKSIIVGEEFDPLSGVTAIDGIDGDITKDMKVSGEVDVWTPGEYTLTYSSTDKKGNTETKERKITVGTPYFKFEEKALTAVYENGKLEEVVSSEEFDTTLCSFALARVSFKASDANPSELVISLTNGTSKGNVAITATESEYVVYFRISQALTEGTFSIQGSETAVVSDVKLEFGAASDSEAPEITLPENYSVVLPGNMTDEAALTKFIVNGVTAQDAIDGNVTSKLAVNFGDLVLGDLTTEETVTIYVEDAAGNIAEKAVKVQFAKTNDTHIIVDPTFDTATAETDSWKLNGGSGDPTLEFVDGTMVHQVTGPAAAGWDSASSPYIRVPQSTFRAGNWYLLQFDAKAERERNMTVRIGLDTTEQLGWIENFQGASNYPLNLTTEWATYNVLFYVHSEMSEGGIGTVKLELKLGTFYWDGNKELSNPVALDNLQFYLVSNTDNAPEIKEVDNMPTAFAKGEALPDLTGHITAYDVEDGGNITITSDMVDMSAVDMNTPGKYTVNYAIPDSAGNVATHSIEIEVLAEKDETAPVIALAAGVETTVDQNSAAIDLTKAVTVTDNVDGEIVVTKKMITGSVDVTKAGTYEVKYTVYDRSGNKAEYEVTFTVNDKEAPSFKGKESIILKEGDKATLADLLALVKVTDNVDGTITLTEADVTGYADFVVDGKIANVGEYTLTFTATDAAGNVGTYDIHVEVIEKGETEIVVDQVVFDMLVSQPVGENADIAYENGVATISISDMGGWASYNKTKVSFTELVEGETYRIVLTAKADQDRAVKTVIGQSLWADPWFDKFSAFEAEGAGIFELGTEYQTFEFDFVYDKPLADGGPAMEFQFGPVTGSCVAGNNIYVSQFQICTVKEVAVGGTEIVLDELMYDMLTAQPAGENAEITYADGVATIAVAELGGWASFNKVKASFANLVEGQSYRIVFTAKADAERAVKFVIGQSLWSEPWFDKFSYFEGEGAGIVELGTDYATYTIDFVYDKPMADGGPAMEFQFGPVLDGDTAGNIYITQLEIYSTKEVKAEAEVFTGNVTISGFAQGGSTYEASEDFYTVKSLAHGTGTGQWARWNLVAASEKFSHAKVVIAADTNLNLLIKLDDANNGYDNKPGNKQYLKVKAGEKVEYVWDLASMGIDSTKLVKLVVWVYDASGETTEGTVRLAHLEYFNENAGPVEPEQPTEPEQPSEEERVLGGNVTFSGFSQGGSTYKVSEDKLVVESLNHGTSMNQWGRWDLVAASEKYTNAKVVFKAITTMSLGVKFDDANNAYDKTEGNKQYKKLVEGEELVLNWDFAASNMDTTKLVKLVIWGYDSTGATTTGSFQLVSIEYFNEKVEEERVLGGNVTFSGFSQGGSAYSVSEDKLVVNSLNHGTSMNAWGRWDLVAASEKYTNATVVIKALSTMSLGIKFDDANNGYDKTEGNKQYKKLVEGEELVLNWDFAAMNMDTTKLVKLVIWGYDSTGATTTGSFQLVSIEYHNAQ